MKPLKQFTTILLLLVCIPAYSFRIDGNILTIEKGDNLFDIAHALYSDGYDYKKLWRGCMDTALCNDANKIYPDMRFNLDSMKADKVKPVDSIPAKPGQAPPVYLLDKGIDWATILVTLLSAAISAVIAYQIARMQIDKAKKNELEKQQKAATFDFHREFHSDPIYTHRVAGDKLIVKNHAGRGSIFSDFRDLGTCPEPGTQSVFYVYNFYNRLWVALSNHQLEDKLVPELFGDIFFYWYDYCFGITKTAAANAPGSSYSWQTYENIRCLRDRLEKEMAKQKHEDGEDRLTVCRAVNANYMENRVAAFHQQNGNAVAAANTQASPLAKLEVELKYDKLKEEITGEAMQKAIGAIEEKYELKPKGAGQ